MKARKFFLMAVLVLVLMAIVVSVAAAAPAKPAPTLQFQPVTLTPELVAVVVAGFLSLAFTYIPRLRTKYAELDEDIQRSIMGALTVICAGVLFALACTPALGFPFVICPTGGVWELIAIILLSVGVNQGTHSIMPKPADVKAIKAAKAEAKILATLKATQQ